MILSSKYAGFEAGGPNTPSNISPWAIIGNETSILVSTDRSSCFDRNKVALQMEVLCDINGENICPKGGVGVYNPGYWGMVRKRYFLVLESLHEFKKQSFSHLSSPLRFLAEY